MRDSFRGELSFRIDLTHSRHIKLAPPVAVRNHNVEGELVLGDQVHLECFTLVRVVRNWELTEVEPWHIPDREDILITHLEMDRELGLQLLLHDD